MAPIVVPNVLRTIARRVSEESWLVKLELSALTRKVLSYHEHNSENMEAKSVPAAVSKQLLPPLRELADYIFRVCSRDATVGNLLKVLSSSCLKIDTNQPHYAHQNSNRLCHYGNAATNTKNEHRRPAVDSPDALRMVKQSIQSEAQSVKSISSDSFRTSTVVTVPSTMKQPMPRAASTLEELDLFFTPGETLAAATEEVRAPSSSSPSACEVSGSTNKATLDLSGATWLHA